MRKTILTVLLIVLTTFMYSQNRLGYTFEEVKTEFNYEKYDLCEKILKKKSYIQITQPTATTLFTFDKNSVCKEVVINPKELKHLIQYVDLFNERFNENGYQKWYGTNNDIDFKIILDDGDQFIFTERK